MNNLKREYSKTQTKLKILYADRLEERITTEEYDKLIIELKERQEEILEQQKQHSRADKEFYITTSRIQELANKAVEIFESSKIDQKRQLLQYLLQNSTFDGKRLFLR